jgi:hypothetical protein
MLHRFRRPFHFLWLGALLLLATLFAAAQTGDPIANANSLTDITIYADRDTLVRASLPDTNYGNNIIIAAGRDEFTLETQSLVGFNLSEIPANATLQSAVLRLQVISTSDNLPLTGNIYAVTGAWTENTVTWNTRPPLSSTLIDSIVMPGTAGITLEWDVLSLVQAWHNGTPTNHGLAVTVPSDTVDQARSFTSSEGTSTTDRPRLFISYTLPTATATATPTTVSGTATPTATGTPPSPTATSTPTPTATPTISATIQGRFFHDANGNSTYDTGETRFAGVYVYLTSNNRYVGSATTTSEGLYTITGVPRGYHLLYIGSGMPFNYEPSPLIPNLVDGHRGMAIFAPGTYPADYPLISIPPATPVPFPSLNLFPTRVEIVQVNTNSSNPLVAGKSTLVRLYVGVSGTTDPVFEVGGRLALGDPDDPTIWRTGIDSLNQITVSPGDPGSPTSPLYRTLNFLLPASWTVEGTRSFAVWVNDDYGPHLGECNGCQHNNIIEIGRTFYEYAPLNMVALRVQTSGGVMPSLSERMRMLPRVRQLFPIDRVNIYIISADPVRAPYDYDVVGDGCGPGWNNLLDDLQAVNSWTDDPAPMLHYHGFLDDTVPSTVVIDGRMGTILGCGDLGGWHGISKVQLGGTPDTTAHELGHNFGWWHVACDGEANTDPDYPVAGGLLDWSGISELQAWFDRAITADLMSYCPPRWISQYQYDRALARFDRRAASQARSMAEVAPASPIPAGDGNYLMIGALIENGALAQLNPGYRITLPGGSSDHPGSGPFSLEVQNQSGVVLFTRHFAVRETGDSEDETSGTFHEMVPFADSARRIVLKYNGATIGSRQATANAPVVQMTSPNGGESWSTTGTYTLTWTGSDADGETLTYTLQYSKDGGATWMAITNDLTATSYPVDASVFAGSQQALVRVIASDGLNTDSDVSDAPFTVAPKAPMAFILAPEDQQVFRLGSIVQFDGIATDVEDGPLDGTTFVWSSDLQGVIDSGATMSTDSLLPGWHTITLTATDSDGMSASTTISVLIGGRLYLPLIRR